MVQVFPSLESLSEAAAALFVSCTQKAVQANGRCSVALAGGNTPARAYSLLAAPARRNQIPWDKLHVFWGDERFVPPDHPMSNYRAAREALLDHVPIPPANIHPILCTATPSQTVASYEQTLRTYFATAPMRFDLVLLGLGADGHTASLFPGNPDFSTSPASVAATTKPGDAVSRITLTPRILNQAATIAFLVAGADKAPALKQVIEEPALPARLPAQLIQPATGEILWFLDQPAAALLRT